MQEENISNYIIDSSFILGYLLPDENTKKVEIIFEKYKEGKVNFFASPLLSFEVANGLKSAVVRKRIDSKKAQTLIKDFINITITFVDVDFSEVLEKSLQYNLSVYDASYVWLAQEKKLPLLTLDKHLQKLVGTVLR